MSEYHPDTLQTNYFVHPLFKNKNKWICGSELVLVSSGKVQQRVEMGTWGYPNLINKQKTNNFIKHYFSFDQITCLFEKNTVFVWLNYSLFRSNKHYELPLSLQSPPQVAKIGILASWREISKFPRWSRRSQNSLRWFRRSQNSKDDPFSWGKDTDFVKFAGNDKPPPAASRGGGLSLGIVFRFYHLEGIVFVYGCLVCRSPLQIRKTQFAFNFR